MSQEFKDGIFIYLIGFFVFSILAIIGKKKFQGAYKDSPDVMLILSTFFWWFFPISFVLLTFGTIPQLLEWFIGAMKFISRCFLFLLRPWVGRHCVDCGNFLPVGSKFCRTCGTTLKMVI
jgi:hypothetical protein